MSKLYIGNKLIIDPDVKLEKVEITQAAYDTLADKKDNIVYCITDAPNQIQYLHEEVESVSKDLKTKFNTLETNIQGDLDRKAEVTDLSNVLADNIVNNPTYEDLSTTTINDLKAELQIDSKLDKDIYETANKQFNQSGYFHFTTHVITTTQNFSNTGYIPLNHNAPIVVKGSGTEHVSAVAFFDYNYGFISNVRYSKLSTTVIDTIPVEEFPAQAAFFMCSSLLSSNPTFTNGTNQEARENAVSNLVHEAKKALFIDEWNMLFGENGKYDPSNARDADHPFLGNDIWMTYEEAMAVMLYGSYESYMTIASCMLASLREKIPHVRTTIPKVISSNKLYFPTLEWLPYVEIIHFCVNATATGAVPRLLIKESINIYGNKLREIRDVLVPMTNCKSFVGTQVEVDNTLTTLYLYNLDHDFNISRLAALSLESMQYLINNAANKTPITIEVHPSMYAKLTGGSDTPITEGTPAISELPEAEQETAKWRQVNQLAAARGITFITAE